MTAHNLPRDTMMFVGRQQEIADVTRLLNTPTCHLLTLVGPGGIGKTRLAIEVAAQQQFSQSVFFVPLQQLTSPDLMTSAIADGLDLQFYPSIPPLQQLFAYLAEKAPLLVLDNFEHLIDGTELLSGVLKAAPETRMLVTSRERLNLLEEWVFDVREFNYPVNEVESDIEAYDAVQLFLHHARRVQAGFRLTSLNKPAVIRICRLVGGLPLGIELAAAWVRVLSCEAIADEIERSMDILESSTRNMENRHRTMRATFEPIWKRLSVEEGDVFKQLSVFRGGFTRDAAEKVAGASLRPLSSLVDKCLIRREPDGRYQMHPLLRQYAKERLERNAEETQRAYHLHAAYFMQLLKQSEPDLNSARQRETIQELELEIDNVRAAWQRAIDEANVALLQQGGHAYYLFCDMQGRYQELLSALDKAIARLESIEVSEERDFTLAILQNAFGGMFIRVGQFEKARAAVQESLSLYQRTGRRPSTGFGTTPLTHLGLLSVIQGDYDAGVAQGETALERIEASDALNRMFTLYVLATAAYSQAKFEASLRYARQAYKIADGLGDKYFGSYILVVMGNIAQALEDYDQAWEYYQTSFDFKKYANELGGMAFALNCMARIAWLRGDYSEAKRLFQEGHNLYREIHDPGGLATSLFGLGDIALAETDYFSARAHFFQALVIAIDIHWSQLILAILAGVSEYLLKTGDTIQAASYLALVARHPASEPPTRSRAEQLLRRTEPPAAIPDLDTTALQLRDRLKQAETYPLIEAARGMTTSSFDSLTERETEILHLLAEGRTNQEIAEMLVVVVGTIKAHNNHIYSKLGVSNRVQAIARARELGLL